MTHKQPSTVYYYACETPKCTYSRSVAYAAGVKPPVTITCPRCKKIARVVEVGK